MRFHLWGERGEVHRCMPGNRWPVCGRMLVLRFPGFALLVQALSAMCTLLAVCRCLHNLGSLLGDGC